MATERLHKFLARAGIASRRLAEDMIRHGRVNVIGVEATLGMSINPDIDKVTCDGKSVEQAEAVIYAFNKPVGVTSTVRDRYAAKTVAEFFPKNQRVYPAGRLDKNSSGLLLITNDGELANQLMHPRYSHEKEYVVELSGVSSDNIKKFTHRFRLDGAQTQPMRVAKIKRVMVGRWLVNLVLKEGKKRQIRRVANLLGYTVEQLARVRVGKLRLGDLRPGEWRIVKREDII